MKHWDAGWVSNCIFYIHNWITFPAILGHTTRNKVNDFTTISVKWRADIKAAGISVWWLIPAGVWREPIRLWSIRSSEENPSSNEMTTLLLYLYWNWIWYVIKRADFEIYMYCLLLFNIQSTFFNIFVNISKTWRDRKISRSDLESASKIL